MKFLVVDDSLTMRRIIKNSLQKLGFADVSEASNGLEALEEIGKGGINIVLTDWNMPEMDGMTFVTKLRQQDAQIPILMITTNAAGKPLGNAQPGYRLIKITKRQIEHSYIPIHPF